MRASKAIFILILFIFEKSIAQPKSFSGYYITQNGEKTTGIFTDYQQWDVNPTEVGFTASTGSSIRLTPSNCQAFLIDGYDEFLAYTGKRLINPIGDAQTLMKADNESTADRSADVSVFLRLVKRTNGYELYALKDVIRTNFFIRSLDGPLTELRFKEFFSQTEIKSYPEYRQQLQGIFSDFTNRGLNAMLADLPYTEEALSDFFERLFPSKQRVVKTNKSDDGWIVAAGVSMNFLRVEGSNTAIEVGQKYNASVSPLISIGYMTVSKRNFGKYFFYPQLKLFRYHHAAETKNSVTKTTISFGSDLALLPELNGGVSLINKPNIRFQLSFGAGLMYSINNQHIRNRYNVADGNLYFTTVDKLAQTTIMANATAGVLTGKHFLFSVSYQIPSVTGELEYFSSKLSAVQIRMGYKLN